MFPIRNIHSLHHHLSVLSLKPPTPKLAFPLPLQTPHKNLPAQMELSQELNMYITLRRQSYFPKTDTILRSSVKI